MFVFILSHFGPECRLLCSRPMGSQVLAGLAGCPHDPLIVVEVVVDEQLDIQGPLTLGDREEQ